MDSKAFMSILFSLTVALATDSNATMNRLIEATDTTPFAQCNPFNAQARSITSCEKYFNSSSLTFEACDLNLGWHDICVGAIPEGKGSLREICPTECARKVLDPELEDEDALAVENFIDFLKKGGSKHGRRSSRSKVAGRRKLHLHSQAVPGYEAYPDYGSSPGNFIAQFEDLTVEECAGLCNGEGTPCVGFTIFDDGWCRLKSAITLRQRRHTFNRATYVKNFKNCEGYKNFIDLPEDWCDSLSQWAICGIGDGKVAGYGYGCEYQENHLGDCKDLNSRDQCVQFALPRVCGPDDYVVVDVMAHPTYGAHGRYFEISSLDWTTMAGAWNSFYNIDQWRDGVRIVENRQIRGWEDDNGIHGRYEPFASSVNGDWQPDDIITLTGNCESLATV